MNPFLDNTLSLEARGALAYIIAAGLETIAAQQMQDLGCGREKAYRILGELAGAGLLTRSKLGFRVTANPSILKLSPGESLGDVKSYGFSEKPYILTNQECPESRISSAQELLESRNSCTPPTTLIESLDHDLKRVVESYGFSGNPTLSEGESEQLTLTGCPEPPPHSAPPSPAETAKPKRPRKPPPADEVKSLYGPMFELTKTVRSGKAAMGVYTKCAALWREFQATPEQVTAFWDWFKIFSIPAQYAAREQRPLNPPLPRQVHELWPQFLVWWQARQQELARRTQADERRRAAPPDEQRATGDLVRQLNPFRNRLTKPIPVATD